MQSTSVLSSPAAPIATHEAPTAEAEEGVLVTEVDATVGSPGLAPLCSGKLVMVSETAPYRGVVPKDNGRAWCCPLKDTSFLCVVRDGHQHEPTILVTARFYAKSMEGTRSLTGLPDALQRPDSEMVVEVLQNRGMRAPATVVAALRARRQAGDAFSLAAEPSSACAPANPDTQELCKSEGTYRMHGGTPHRAK